MKPSRSPPTKIDHSMRTHISGDKMKIKYYRFRRDLQAYRSDLGFPEFLEEDIADAFVSEIEDDDDGVFHWDCIIYINNKFFLFNRRFFHKS